MKLRSGVCALMNLFDIIYTIIIGPLKMLFEVIYTLAYYMCSSPGLSIIALSLVMNFLVLPLYAKADKMQEEQNNIEKKLKRGVDHIKKTFKGDERYMMLQTYYRQNNYKPTDALKGSISLLLEVPFFMAAYAFLSNLNVLKHASFGPIVDLGAPDQMLSVFGITLNLLPILMTLINIISSYIYTKGLPAKAKVQLYVMAGLFLVLLYDSPAGLVFYWTLNNLFSLVKNIFYKLKNPKFVLSILSSLVSVLGLVFVLIKHPFTFNQTVLVVAVLLAMQLPLLLYLFKGKISIGIKGNDIFDTRLFILCSIFLALFVGVMIPMSVIKAAPVDFLDGTTLYNPLNYVLYSACIGTGTFCLWMGVFYYLASKGLRQLFSFLSLLLSALFVVNYMVFNYEFGLLSVVLEYEKPFYFELSQIKLNLLASLAIVLVLFVLSKINIKLIKTVIIAGCAALVIMNVASCFTVNKELSSATKSVIDNRNKNIKLKLNKDEKNVVVLLLDRQIGSYIPYIFNELPELQEKFAGFTYYPNTVTFADATNIATPSIYGGYEYCPVEVNKREDELLLDKHNEALLVLPTIFSELDYNVTVLDPQYVNYKLTGDLSIYDDMENVEAYNAIGTVKLDNFDYLSGEQKERIKRNLFCFSITKCLPLAVQPIVYDGASYLSVDFKKNTNSEIFLNNYAVLNNLSSMTEIVDENQGSLVLLYNSTPHETAFLSLPNYELKALDDNSSINETYVRYDAEGNELHLNSDFQVSSYHVNVAALKEVGNWLDYLRQEGIYDNTKIIVVSDHGFEVGNVENQQIDFGGYVLDSTRFNSTLMVKDYNSTEFEVNEEFMTIADVPGIVVKDIDDNAFNPFTGNKLIGSYKEDNDMKLFISGGWFPDPEAYKFSLGACFTVSGDIFDQANWKYSSIDE